MVIEAGQVINSRYRVIDEIGKGGTSRVYLVMDQRVGKCWAMKVIKRQEGLALFLAKREREMLASIDFYMFPKIVDAWQDRINIYIVSDYIEGSSLDRIIRNRGSDKRQAVNWALKILEAVDYLHGLSPPVLYLDLKPDNIIIRPDGRLCLIDFGIAGRIASNIIPIGTPGFAAPEQYHSDRDKINIQTDIFAFGMTYYAIRTGNNPDRDLQVNMRNIRSSRILSRREKSFILQCIEEDSTGRFRDISQVRQSINHIKSFQFKRKNSVLSICVLIAVFIISIFIFQFINLEKSKSQAAREMILEADRYIEDGDYTKEGIKVITTFINSGCLDENTEQEFCYEVAKNYFERQKEYTSAQRYFEKLNREKYPEAEYYIELCRLNKDLNFDENQAQECIGRFYRSTKSLPESERRYDNIFFIADCYENYSSNKLEGIKKSLTVLEDGYRELKEIKPDDCKESYKDDYRDKYEKKIALLYERARILDTERIPYTERKRE